MIRAQGFRHLDCLEVEGVCVYIDIGVYSGATRAVVSTCTYTYMYYTHEVNM